ncbi:hypothetical protein ACFJIY_19565 [Pimelobacter simplex]|uniref:hypothetical protein n=1 Tax=Nocardioides simplex TaxID=2045 RepID=UPI00366B72AB
MTDPETLFARLVAGRPARIREIDAELVLEDTRVTEAVDQLTAGLAGVRWNGGLAVLACLGAGQRVFVASCLTSWRLYRTGRVLDRLADQVDAIEEWARTTIGVWRQRDPALDPAQVDSLRQGVSFVLVQGILVYGALLGQARSDITSSDDELADWLKDGASDDYRWALAYGGGRGPRVPDAAANGDDGGWTPQGLGYDPATGQYVTTSYRTNVGDPDDKGDDYDDSQLTVVDPGTGDVVNQVRLGGPGNVSLGPSHAGGVAVNGDHVYVVGGGKLYDYDLGEIRSAAPGATVHPSAVIEPPATSYVTVAGGKVYLGKWDKEGKDDEIWVYDIGSDGRPDLSTGSRYDAPAGSNGVAVLPGDRLVFSVNHGRGEAGELESYEVRDGELHGTGSIPVANLPEELIVTPDGRLVGINESGASDYAPWDTDGRDRDGDHGGEDDGIGDTGGSEGTDLADFWARTHLFDLPLGALDGDGFHVEPVTLEQGALQAYGAADGLDGVRTRLTGLHLPTTLLGEVAGADELSTAVDSALATVRSDLRHLAPAADRMGDELKATSSDYSTTDLAAGLVLNLLLTRILG